MRGVDVKKVNSMEDVIYSRYRWFILVSLCIVQATAVMVLVSPATMIGEISATMGIDMGMVTQVTMVFNNIFVGISAFLGGWVVDRFGAYRVWVACIMLFIIGTLLVPVAGNTIWGILLVRLIQGFGAGPIMATAPLVATQWFPSQERGIVIGFQGATVSVGAIVSLNFVPLVFGITGSWQAALAWLTVFLILALLISLIVIFGPEPPEKDILQVSGSPGVSENDMKKAYSLHATWAAILCGMWFSWVVRLINDVITNYLVVDPPVGVGLGPTVAGGVLSGVNAVITIAAISSGFILEKLFRGRIRCLVLLGFIIPAVLLFSIKFYAVYSNIFILSACMWISAFGIALTSPLIMTFFAKNYPEGIMGKLGGLIIVFNQVGIFVGIAAGSLALSMTGRYDGAIYLMGAGAFMGFLSAFLLKEPKIFSSHECERIKKQ